MKITSRCIFDGNTYTMDIPMLTPNNFAMAKKDFENGALLQDAFSFLSAEEREFIFSGTPPDVWDQLFRERSED